MQTVVHGGYLKDFTGLLFKKKTSLTFNIMESYVIANIQIIVKSASPFKNTSESGSRFLYILHVCNSAPSNHEAGVYILPLFVDRELIKPWRNN